MPEEEEKETKEEKIERFTKELEKLREEVKEGEEEEEVEEGEEEGEEDPKITFEQFKELYDANDDLDNSEIYKAFPTVNHGTLRGWKSKAKLLSENPPEGEDTPTPLTKKEIDELVAKEVREALKIKRKEPSKAKPVSEPVTQAAIKKNWYEEIV